MKRRLGAVLLGSTTILATMAVPAGAFAQAAVNYAIQAGSLANVLNSFAEQSGVQILYDAGLTQGRSSPGLHGSFGAPEGLSRLLAGTGLTYRQTGARTFTLEPAPADTGAVQLGPVRVEGDGTMAGYAAAETSAWGPVVGYAASRSATGTKTDTPLIETPQAITVVTRAQMDVQQVQTVNQALRYTAGVTTDFIGTGPYDNPAYARGFITENYVDGMRQLDNGGFVQAPLNDSYGLERIEVLRGPSSVLYGQGTPGGVLNMVTKRPIAEAFYEFAVQAGSFSRFQATADLGGPIDGEGKLLYRLTAQGLTSHSQFEGDRRRRWSVAPALTWRPGPDTSWTVLLHHLDEPKTGYLNAVPAVGSILPSANGKIDFDRNFSNPEDYVARRKEYAATSLFEHRFGDTVTFRQNFRYRHDKKYQDIYVLLNGGIYWNLGADYESYTADTQIEARLTTGPIGHTILAGFDYVRGDNDYFSAFGFGAGVDPFDPVDYRPAVPATYRFYRRNDARIDQKGVYIQDQIALGNLRLLLGGRHDWAKSRNNDLAFEEITRTDDKAFTGRAGLVYLFDNGLAPYASYAESFKPSSGSYSPARGGGSFKPTTGQQYELGIKYQPPGGGMLLTASVYRLVQKNVTTTDPDDFDYSIQTGAVRSRGVELEARANLTASWGVIAAASYLDNRITRAEVEDDLQGKRPIINPKYSASLWTDYRFAGSLAGLRLGGGVRYVGRTWADSGNTAKVPAFTLFDATIGYDFPSILPGASIDIAAQNLADKSYIQSCGAVSDGTCFIGQKRTVYATLRYRW